MTSLCAIGITTPKKYYATFATRPSFIHVVQTRIRTARPSTDARTLCRLGIQRRRVRLWAWLILFPESGRLSHNSQTFDIVVPSDNYISIKCGEKIEKSFDRAKHFNKKGDREYFPIACMFSCPVMCFILLLQIIFFFIPCTAARLWYKISLVGHKYFSRRE